jgi:Protein of unknown function (DUF998)
LVRSISTTASRRWAWLAVVGVLLYIAIDISLALLRPDVSLLHDPESDYGNGAWSCLMDLNFLIRAGLSIAAILAIAPVVGLLTPDSVKRAGGAPAVTTQTLGPARLGLALIGVWALASGLLAFFPDDLLGAAATAHGRVHLLAALVAFIAVAVGTPVLSRVLDRVALWSSVAGPLLTISIAAIVALLLLGATGLRARALGGLWERLFLGLELAWLLLVSLRIARTKSDLPRVRTAAQ